MRYHAYVDSLGWVWIEDANHGSFYQLIDDERFGWGDEGTGRPFKQWTLLKSDRESDMNPFKSMIQQQNRVWERAERSKHKRPYVTL